MKPLVFLVLEQYVVVRREGVAKNCPLEKQVWRNRMDPDD